MPNSESSPLIWLPCAVLAFTNPCLALCTDRIACCSTVFSGTNRMFGLLTASQIASASATSFLLVFTYGFTNCGAISFVMPETSKLPRPVMCTAAGFHPDQTRLQVREIFCHVFPPHLFTHRNLAALTHAVDLVG